MRKKVSFILKICIVIFSFLGIILAMLFAKRDGYSHWSKRLLYFTQLSNLWIGLASLTVALYTILQKQGKHFEGLYLTRFIFTVSITITGVVYCTLLAPFAEDDFPAWTFGNIVTHVVVPILAITDFIIDDRQFSLSKTKTLLSTVPPLAYFIIVSVLCVNNFDFGRGDPYPYFFLNFYSQAKIFGFVPGDFTSGNYPQLGAFYWIVLFLLMVLGFAYLLRYIHLKLHKPKSQVG